MEDLFPALIVILIGAISAISSNKKKQQAAGSWPKASTAPKAEAPQPWQPAQPTVLPPTTITDIPSPVIVPTVHPHFEPDCDTHDTPGSLGVTSTEGKDPCHEEQLTHTRTTDDPIQDAPGMTFDWSGENMVKAFVMQEVLTRPCQRQAR
ncbi:MAG: hypothetical protein E7318_07355 [Clostridiales bacterium]|nr:hypothetical protein [Clostridiales bacterium]